MIISFSWTTEAVLAGRKTVTRRDWKVDHAAKFVPGSIVQAYDRSPRNGGNQVARIRIRSIERENVGDMPDDDYEKEGFAYLYEKYGGEEVSMKAFEAWRRADVPLWVVRFDVIDAIPVDEWIEKSRSSRQSRMSLPTGSA